MDDFQGFRKIFKTRLQKHYVLFDIWVEFREFVIEWNYFAICETKKKNPDFITTCIWVIAKKKKKKTSFFFNKRLRTIRLQLLMPKKKKTLSDTNYEGKKMYRNRKQHDICGKITRQRWLQIRALLWWGTRSIWHPWLSNRKNSVRKLAT